MPLLLLIALANPLSAQSDKAQANLALTTRYFTEVYGEAKFDLINELFAENYTHISTSGKTWTGRDRLHQVVVTVVGMMPNPKPRIIEAVADDEKVMLLIDFESDRPAFANQAVKRPRINFPETFLFWVRDGRIWKGRSAGAHLEFVKQASGYEGTLEEITAILSDHHGSGKKQD